MADHEDEQEAMLLEHQIETTDRGWRAGPKVGSNRRHLEEILSPAVAHALAIGLAVFIAVKLVLLGYLGWNTQYIMDEYWMAGHSQLLSANLYQDVWPAKTMLYAGFFWIANALGSTTVEVMHLARVETLILAVAGLGLLYRIARNVGLDRLEATLSIAFVLGFSSYMERIFMVRPEPLALAFTLLALYLVTRGRETAATYLIAGLLCGAAFLSLQKAVYFNAALGLALVGDWLLRGSLRRAVLAGAVLVAGWAAAVGLYGLFFWAQGADLVAVFTQVFYGSTGNALRGHVVYGDDLTQFLVSTFQRNAPLYIVAVFAWLAVLPRLRSISSPERMAWIFTGVICALVFLHKAPWPYNFIMAVPFLGIWGARFFASLAAWAPRSLRPNLRLAGFLVPLLVLLLLSFGRNLLNFYNDNHDQNATISTAESMLGPIDTYADGLGMIVTRRRAGDDQWWAKGPIAQINAAAEKGDFSMIEAVLTDEPKIWIHTYRTSRLWDVLNPYLEDSYVPIAANIFVTGAVLMPGNVTPFQNRWSGQYALFRADGSVVQDQIKIDGIATTAPFELPLGEFRIGPVTGNDNLFLLPSDLKGPFSIAPPESHTFIFRSPHNF